MDPRTEDRDQLWFLLALLVVGGDDDPLTWELHEHLYRQLRQRQGLTPELDRLFQHYLERGPRHRPWRQRVLEQARENTTAALDGFRTSFQQPVVERLNSAEQSVAELRQSIGTLQGSLEGARRALGSTRDEWLTQTWLQRVGVDPADAGLRDYVPVRIYIGEPIPERRVVEALFRAVTELANSLGIEPADDVPEETGSIKKRWWVRVADFFRSRDASRRIEQAVVATLDQQRANRDHTDAEAERARAQARHEVAEADLAAARVDEVRARSKLLTAEALEKSVNAAERLNHLLKDLAPGTTIQIGEICVAKRADSSEAVAAALSPEQLREWERKPALRADPARAHAQLEEWKRERPSSDDGPDPARGHAQVKGLKAELPPDRVPTSPFAARFANLDLDPPEPKSPSSEPVTLDGDSSSSPEPSRGK